MLAYACDASYMGRMNRKISQRQSVQKDENLFEKQPQANGLRRDSNHRAPAYLPSVRS
jgi:hypothetical protein